MNGGGAVEGGAPSGSVGSATPPVDVARAGVAPEAHVLGEPVGPAIPETGAPHAAVAEARTFAFTAEIAEPMSKIPPDADEALKRAAKGPAEDKAQVSAEAARQAQLQEQARVNAYTEITGFGIPLDENSTVDGVIGQIQANGYGWQNDEVTRAHIAGAIEHAQAQASQPEAQPSGAFGSAVAAEVGSTDGQPLAEGEAPVEDRTDGQGAETGTSTTSGEGAASSSGGTEDSTASPPEPADATASSEKPVTPEEMMNEIRHLRKESGEMRRVLELVVGRMQKLDKEYEAFWKKALAILLLIGQPEFEAAFGSLQEELKTG